LPFLACVHIARCPPLPSLRRIRSRCAMQAVYISERLANSKEGTLTRQDTEISTTHTHTHTRTHKHSSQSLYVKPDLYLRNTSNSFLASHACSRSRTYDSPAVFCVAIAFFSPISSVDIHYSNYLVPPAVRCEGLERESRSCGKSICGFPRYARWQNRECHAPHSPTSFCGRPSLHTPLMTL